MRAADHTEAMLLWWKRADVDRADLVVRRPVGSMIWQRDIALSELPLGWARAENARNADIYIRPARGYPWPVIFLDDVSVDCALGLARVLRAMVVQTSPAGGCHVWLLCDRALAEPHRQQAQRWWIGRVGADPGSVSGEHLGRLAGFKNWKRGGSWVNVLAAPSDGCPWEPTIALSEPLVESANSRPLRRPPGSGPLLRDTSESGREWGWVCGLLETGHDPVTVYCRLLQRARPRRGDDAARYARRTVDKAIVWVGRAHPRRDPPHGRP